MSLKTSLFDKSLIKSDIKRLWWIPILNALAIFTFSVFGFFDRVSSMRGANMNYEQKQILHSRFVNYMDISFIFALIFGFVLALFLYNYLFSSSSVSFFHGMPLTRKKLYISHGAVGALMIVIPALINAVILLCSLSEVYINIAIDTVDIYSWFAKYLLYAFLAFTGTVFCAAIAGNIPATVVLVGGFIGIPVLLVAFVSSFMQEYFYGYTEPEWLNMIIEYLYILPESIFLEYHFVSYLSLILILSVGSYFIYKKRNLENHSEIVAFDKLKVVFVYAVALSCGIIGYFYFDSMFDTNIFFMLPFGYIGLIAANMISRKTLNIKGSFKPLLLYTVFVVILFVCIKTDITGYEKRVPELEDVESVTYNNFSYREYVYNDYGTKFYFDEQVDNSFKTEEEIWNVIKLHGYAVENRSQNKYFDESEYVYIQYKLKNGFTLKRRYTVDYSAAKDLVDRIYETETLKAIQFPITDNTEKKIVSLTVEDSRLKNSSFKFTEGDIAISEIEEALKKDILNRKGRYKNYSSATTQISVVYSRKGHYEGKEFSEFSEHTMSESYSVLSSYENTIAVLKKYGFYDSLPDIDDYDSVRIRMYDYEKLKYEEFAYEYSYSDYHPTVAVEEYNSDYVTVMKKDDIKLIYDFAFNSPDSDSKTGKVELEMLFRLKNGHEFYILRYSYIDDIPEIFIKYLMNQ